MAVVHYTERVDADGNVVIRHVGLPAGTEVRVMVEVDDAHSLQLLSEEDAVYWALARTNLDFWDNEVDDATWNS